MNTAYQNNFSFIFFFSFIIHCFLLFFLLALFSSVFINTKEFKPFKVAEVVLVPNRVSAVKTEVTINKPAAKKTIVKKPVAKVDKPKAEFSLSAKKSSDLIGDLAVNSIDSSLRSDQKDEEPILKDDFAYLYVEEELIKFNANTK